MIEIRNIFKTKIYFIVLRYL